MKFAFEVSFTIWLENLTLPKICKKFPLLLMGWSCLCLGTQKIPHNSIIHTAQGKELKKSLNVFTVNKPNHLQLPGTGEELTGGVRPELHLGNQIPDPDPFPDRKLCRVIGLQVGDIYIFFKLSKTIEMKEHESLVGCRRGRKQYLAKFRLELYQSALFHPFVPYRNINYMDINYMGWYSGLQLFFLWPKKIAIKECLHHDGYLPVRKAELLKFSLYFAQYRGVYSEPLEKYMYDNYTGLQLFFQWQKNSQLKNVYIKTIIYQYVKWKY